MSSFLKINNKGEIYHLDLCSYNETSQMLPICDSGLCSEMKVTVGGSKEDFTSSLFIYQKTHSGDLVKEIRLGFTISTGVYWGSKGLEQN